MILLIESSRYIEHIEKTSNLMLTKKQIQCDFGKLEVYEDSARVIAIVEIGIQEQIKRYSDIPMAVLSYIKESSTKHLGLLCKAGGINRLLKVGNVAFISDYLDFSQSERYPFNRRTLNSTERNMSEPFSKTWITSCVEEMTNWRRNYNTNIFDSVSVVCTQGPFFESAAEIEAFKMLKVDIVAHSICPYVYYAKALAIEYLVLTVISNVYGTDDKEFQNDTENNLMIAKLADIMIKSRAFNEKGRGKS